MALVKMSKVSTKLEWEDEMTGLAWRSHCED